MTDDLNQCIDLEFDDKNSERSDYDINDDVEDRKLSSSNRLSSVSSIETPEKITESNMLYNPDEYLKHSEQLILDDDSLNIMLSQLILVLTNLFCQIQMVEVLVFGLLL